MLRNMVTVSKKELGFEGWFTPLITYPLKDDVGMGVACVNLRLSLRKGRYVGHLPWDSMGKFRTAWANIYGDGVFGLRDIILGREGKNFTETTCPTQGMWFEEFMRGSQLQMRVIKKQYFVVTSEMVKAMLVGLDI